MPNRREFFKRSALLGTVAGLVPISEVLGEERKSKATTAPVDTYTVDMRSVRARPLPPRQIIIPDVEGFKVLKGDYHMHTLFSDGKVMPAERVLDAVQNGLDAIAISDHIEYRPFFSKEGKWKLRDEQADDFNLWYDVAKPEADKQNLLLVHAAEITKKTMPPGHFNALFTTDNNPIAAAVDDWKTMLRVAADQGAFLLWDHPGWEAPKSGGIEPGAPLRFTDAHKEVCKQGLMHGIEIFNGGQCYPVVSDWCNEYDLALFANSDIHERELEKYGIQSTLRPITLALAKERTIESLREAFFARRTIAWAANTLWGREPWLPALFKASVEMKTVTPGTLELTNKSSLPISLSVDGTLFELPKDMPRKVYHATVGKKLTVVNWLTGMNQPMEIAL